MSQNTPIKYDKDGNIKTPQEFKFKWDKSYDEGMPQRLITLMSEGGTIAEFCLEEMMSRGNFDKHCNNFPELEQAKAMGKVLAEAWWLKQGRKHLIIKNKTESCDGVSISETTKFDNALYRFVMGGRFGHTNDKRLDELASMFEALMAQYVPKPPQFAEEADCEPEEPQINVEIESKEVSVDMTQDLNLLHDHKA